MSRLKNLPSSFIHEDGANWKAGAQPFCKGNNIGADMVLLTTEEGSRSADACLHLVHDQHNVIFLAERFQILRVLFVHSGHAALALDKFHHDTTDRCINRIGQLLTVIDRHIPESFRKWEKVLMERILSGCGQCCDCPAMEGILQRNDLIAPLTLFLPAILARQLDRAFIGLCAGITKENLGISCDLA